MNAVAKGLGWVGSTSTNSDLLVVVILGCSRVSSYAGSDLRVGVRHMFSDLVLILRLLRVCDCSTNACHHILVCHKQVFLD